MLRIHRPMQHRSGGRLSYLWVVAALLSFGCTLITDVDRSKIPQLPVIEPDPVVDAGNPNPPDGPGPDAGLTDAGDAGAEPVGDAGAPDAPTSDAGPDAAVPDGG